MSSQLAHENAVRRAFGERASNYHDRSQSWPWSWLRRAEAHAVLAALHPIQGLRCLDLGCGSGFYTRLLLQEGAAAITAVDFLPAMIDALPRDRVEAVVSDVAVLQLGRTFPRIVSAGLLEFVTEPRRVFEVARDHADPDTVFALLAPCPGPIGLLYQAFHRNNGVHIKLFSADEICRLATQAGWKVMSQKKVTPFAQVMGLSAS